MFAGALMLLLLTCSFDVCFQSRRGHHCGGTGVMSLQLTGKILLPSEVVMPGGPCPIVSVRLLYIFLISARTVIARCRINSFFVLNVIMYNRRWRYSVFTYCAGYGSHHSPTTLFYRVSMTHDIKTKFCRIIKPTPI